MTATSVRIPRPPVDWERIEVQYRAGLMSLREIAAEHEITEGAIRKRGKRFGWVRDLTARVQQKASELVRTETVRTELVRSEAVRSEDYPRTESETVEVEARVVARIEISHRRDIGRARGIVASLLEELAAQTDGRSAVERLAEIAALLDSQDADDPKAAAKIREQIAKVTSLGARASTMKSLADSMRVLVSMEREAFGIGRDDGAGGDYETFIAALRRPAA